MGWLGFRAISEYEYCITWENSRCFSLFQHHGDKWTGELDQNPTKLQLKGEITEGAWFHFKIVVKGNDLKWFIDDQLQAEAKLAKVGDLDVYTKGKVGIWAWQTKASFDDFKVSGPGIGDGATAVDPRQKLATTWSSLKQD